MKFFTFTFIIKHFINLIITTLLNFIIQLKMHHILFLFLKEYRRRILKNFIMYNLSGNIKLPTFSIILYKNTRKK